MSLPFVIIVSGLIALGFLFRAIGESMADDDFAAQVEAKRQHRFSTSHPPQTPHHHE